MSTDDDGPRPSPPAADRVAGEARPAAVVLFEWPPVLTETVRLVNWLLRFAIIGVAIYLTVTWVQVLISAAHFMRSR